MEIQWVSVEDRLPNKKGTYLVSFGLNGNVATRMFKSGYWWGGIRPHSKNDCVSHWMPLPDPPK